MRFPFYPGRGCLERKILATFGDQRRKPFMQKQTNSHSLSVPVTRRTIRLRWLAMSVVIGALASGCGEDSDGLSPGAAQTGGTGGSVPSTTGATGGNAANTGGTPGVMKAPSDVVPSGSQSFSPTGPDTAAGLPNRLFWTYRTAAGKPVRQTIDGGSLTYTFDDLRVEVDQQLKTKTTTLKAALQGNSSGVPMTGSVSQTGVEQLIFKQNTSAVADTNLDMRIVLKADTVTVNVDSKVHVKASEALLWFPDRSDLAQLDVGHEQRQKDVSMTVKGTVTASSLGEQETETVDATTLATEAWVVKEKIESLVVLGKRYKDVVRLSRTSASISMDGETTNGEATFWVARGVGVIQFESFVDGIEEPLLNQLVTTNVGTLE